MAVNPFVEGRQAIVEAGGEDLRLCFQCGACSATCPWGLVRDFLVRRLLYQARLGIVDLGSETTWLCTTCGGCVRHCPRGVNLIDIIKAMRRILTSVRTLPQSLRISIANLSGVGNPLGVAREERVRWAASLDVRTYTKATEWLLFPCCYWYDPRMKEIALSLVRVLNQAHLGFGILAGSENCCGEAAGKVGDEKLFQSLVQSNLELFAEKGVKNILAVSPHCYHAFRNEYPRFGPVPNVMHYTQLVLRVIKERKLRFTKRLNMRVAYHDPCYLGRHNGVYREPREVLQSIPGVRLVEMADCKEESLCCGGGGGRMWMETRRGERFSDLRIQQAIEVGARVIAVACPYCFIMLEDSRLSLGKENAIQIKDVAQLVSEAI